MANLRYEKYVQEIESNKKKLTEAADDLESMIKDMDNLIPKKYDFKTRYIMVDRIQVLSNLYDSLLKYRSEITKQIKDQVSILSKENVEDDLDKIRDSVGSMSIDELRSIIK